MAAAVVLEPLYPLPLVLWTFALDYGARCPCVAAMFERAAFEGSLPPSRGRARAEKPVPCARATQLRSSEIQNSPCSCSSAPLLPDRMLHVPTCGYLGQVSCCTGHLHLASIVHVLVDVSQPSLS